MVIKLKLQIPFSGSLHNKNISCPDAICLLTPRCWPAWRAPARAYGSGTWFNHDVKQRSCNGLWYFSIIIIGDFRHVVDRLNPEEGCNAGGPLHPEVQTSARRTCLGSCVVAVVPAPGVAAVLWTASVFWNAGAGGGCRAAACASGQCSRSAVLQVLPCQYLEILVSSGTACSEDAVEVAMCYLSPVHASPGISHSACFWAWIRCFTTVWSCRCWSVVSPLLAIGRPKKKLTGWFCRLISLEWNGIDEYSGMANAHNIQPGTTWVAENHSKAEMITNQWTVTNFCTTVTNLFK